MPLLLLMPEEAARTNGYLFLVLLREPTINSDSVVAYKCIFLEPNYGREESCPLEDCLECSK